MHDWGIPTDRVLLPFSDPLATANLSDEEHLARIEWIIRKRSVRLVVIDSLRGGHNDDENNSRVGRVLQQLSAIAERTKAAIVIVHHTKKLMVDEEITANSSRGSNAILAMFRCQIGIDRPDPTSKWCRVRVLKENLGVAPKPIGFQVTPKGLEFGMPPERLQQHTRKDEAANWLKNRMKVGREYSAGEIIEEAGQHNYNSHTVRKAAIEILKIQPKAVRKDGKISGWAWKREI
jgi:hypothetical protein